MNQHRNNTPQSVRSIFMSDQHLGFRFSRAEACLHCLRRYQTENLYLVGDFLDGWRLARNWYWPDAYTELVDHILEMIDRGTQVFYTHGNHDDFLRKPHPAVHGVRITDELIHTTADGRKLLVTHGDLFDSVEKRFHRLSRFGSSVYDLLTQFNFLTNRVLEKAGIGEFNYCFAAKRWSKKIVGAVGGFESILTEHARSQGCDGVICGHIHRPELRQSGDGFIYCNSGDWVEHQSIVIEQIDGSLQLIDNGQTRSRVAGRVIPSAVSPPKTVGVITEASGLSESPEHVSL